MHVLFQDLRYALRQLNKSPGFTLISVLVLGIGVGANVAIFSFADALFLRPLPVHDPDQIVTLHTGGAKGQISSSFSYPDYALFRDHSRSFSSLAAGYLTAPLNVVADGDSKEVQGAVVSANYFSLLEVRPMLGRLFLPEEDAVPDRDAVAVISAQLWKTRFSANPSTLGREITVNGRQFKIVGITPDTFHGAFRASSVDLWIPMMMLRLGYRWCDGFTNQCTPLDIFGRLAAGQTPAAAEAELSGLAKNPAENPELKGIVLLPATHLDPASEEFRQIRLLITATSILLLISCANLSGLLLVRGISRRREIAVRLALGAGRLRIARQLLTENLLLALPGGVLGLAISFWARKLLLSFYSRDNEGYSYFYDLTLDWRVLSYTLLLTILMSLFFGLLPAIQATRQNLVAEMKEGSGSVGLERSGWLREILVGAQVALSLVLLVSATLLVRSGHALLRGTNFDPEHVAVLRLRPRLVSYAPKTTEAFYRETVRHLDELLGVKSVALMGGGQGMIWFWNSGDTVQVALPSDAQGSPEAAARAHRQDVSPRFLETLRIPLLQGREFNERDDVKAPRVTIVNETLAHRLWPNQPSPLGRMVMIDGQTVQVVGVAASIQPPNILHAPVPFLYVPFWQGDPGTRGDVRMGVRVAGDPAAALPRIRRAIQSVDPNVPISEDMTMKQQVNGSYANVLLARSVITYCGVLALCLSAIGLYGILSFAVRTRTHEIGIRMALGAQATNIVRMIMRRGVVVVLLGAAVGCLAALGATGLLANWLYGVRPLDPFSFTICPMVLLLTALLASYRPAREAASVDPMVALRYE